MATPNPAAALAVPERPDKVWRALAPLISAPGRRAVRLYNAETGRFSDTGRLSARLPGRPAAVYLFTSQGRTLVLGLDFDNKRAGADAADADMATAAEWLTRCGGAVVTDRSPGGRHLLCPLAIGTTASAAEINHLTRLLGARLPSLDITPNTNPRSGCLSVPGTPAKTGGYRQLDGTLAAAIDAFTTRSAPELLPRLYELLGAVKARTATPATRPNADVHEIAAYCTGDGDQRTLAPAYVRTDPYDPDIAAYAQHGHMPAGQRQWDTPSEARMAVVTAAIARGHSQASLAALIAPGGPWAAGLGQAYSRYRTGRDNALGRDVTKALNWLCANVLKHRYPQHKKKYSQGGTEVAGPLGPPALRRWLAHALAWADVEYRGKRGRWTVHAVLQTLAWHAYTSGEQINGTWLVSVGGRNLSLGTGLLSEDAVWRVLRDLRDRVGSPLILTRPHVGVEADTYALTTPHGIKLDDIWADRVRVEPVHDAWSIAGHARRRIYELVVHHRLTRRADIYAAAAVSPTAGDEAMTALQIVGLITRTGHGIVAAGPVTLDALAAAHDTQTTREERISRYRTERAEWRTWLDDREQQHEATTLAVLAQGQPTDVGAEQSFWATAMANGPPETDEHLDVIELVADILGARIVAT
ncbi:hypothetical protein [Mycolicibacterium sphagni]|uniref:DNA primase/polymerase bifunctional N-terminal domain-containing protein n=1 Tax=Mycolicibacterium sphagni TaxID=1786 RepID=A0ABX2JWM7_9MYCO|nr:hypothetical protein [Mycolicibacterium sphagni]NTY62051.1 hypothetical protein [Mycolicibacterium sphagni]